MSQMLDGEGEARLPRARCDKCLWKGVKWAKGVPHIYCGKHIDAPHAEYDWCGDFEAWMP